MQASPAKAGTGVSWRPYLAILCGCSGLIIGAVACLNYVVDPYLIHQWQSPALQRLRPPQEKLSAWGKTYAIARLQPDVVYLGNSRTELGLPVDAALFAGKTAFNGALSGASLGDAIAMLRYASRHGRLDTVVWGIDAPSFSMDAGANPLDPELLDDGALFFARRMLINLKRGFALDMTADSIRELFGWTHGICLSSLALSGQRDDRCISAFIAAQGGTQGAIGPRLREFAAGAGPTGDALAAFERSVHDLCASGSRVRLYINPTHALSIDALYWAGKWRAMEAWQEALAALTGRLRAAGCDLKLYDFSGYNSVTSEAIPQVSRRPDMANYWEASHYRVHVGAMVLARMFGTPDPALPDDFGVELTGAMLPAHQVRQRAERDLYHAGHARETAFVKALTLPHGKAP